MPAEKRRRRGHSVNTVRKMAVKTTCGGQRQRSTVSPTAGRMGDLDARMARRRGRSGYAMALLWTLAALIVLVVVLVVDPLIRNLTFGTFVAGGRNRKTRLAVMDATAVDSHRRLVLVRRDDIEHLLLIGGPTDVVVEQDIRSRAQPRRPAPHAEPATRRRSGPPSAPGRPAAAAAHRLRAPSRQRQAERHARAACAPSGRPPPSDSRARPTPARRRSGAPPPGRDGGPARPAERPVSTSSRRAAHSAAGAAGTRAAEPQRPPPSPAAHRACRRPTAAQNALSRLARHAAAAAQKRRRATDRARRTTKLLGELAIRQAARQRQAPCPTGDFAEDEMTKLLGELSSHRRANNGQRYPA